MLYRLTSRLKPSSSADQCITILQIFENVERLGLRKKHASLYSVMRPVLDRALVLDTALVVHCSVSCKSAW